MPLHRGPQHPIAIYATGCNDDQQSQWEDGDFDPCISETPENIETKIGQNNCVMGPFNPANFRRNQSKVVRSPYS